MPKIITILFTLLLLSCDKNGPAQPFDETLSQPFTDPRNGKQYKTVKTGNIVWMADNLDYETGDSLSWCLNGDCEKYGRIYNWEKAMNVCPSGWHLPTAEEWRDFDMAMWLPPDGYCDDYVNFDMRLFKGWWTSTNAEKKGTYIYNPGIKKIIAPGDIGGDVEKLGCTVRCIQDNPFINPSVLDSASNAKCASEEYAKYVDSLTLAKYKTATNWCKSIEQDTSEISRFAKDDTLLKQAITQNYNVLCVNPAEITAYWLNSKTKQYERQFDKPAPQCKQCSDLERLLMLEDAIETDEAELDIVEKEENPVLKAELKKAQADYERKFRIRAPWWYMCSDKEHLERLQKAIKTNKPELDYSYGFQMTAYRVGRRLASYERRFKKPAPNWDEKECSDDERWERLAKALKENWPYLTKEEEEKEKKDRYNFRFRYGYDPYIISVNKTATGAVAKYDLATRNAKESRVVLEATLSAEEWQNFANVIQELDVMEWEEDYQKKRKYYRGSDIEWDIEILLSDFAKFNSKGYLAYPTNWDEFVKLMVGIKKRISQKLENRLKTEYEKRFEKPITEQELSTEQVKFSLELSSKTPINSVSQIIITRTATGAVAHYESGPKEGVRLSMEDWLDFINALYKSSFMNWDKKYGESKNTYDNVYRLVIYNSDNIEPQSYRGYNKYPPNWDKFIKVINDVRAKAKKDSATVEVENKLKTEYKKRFGKPISDFKLYAKSMEFSAFSKWIDNVVFINLNRTATGAVIEYKIGYDDDIATRLKARLPMEDWLDFLDNLQECPKTKWDTRDMCCRKNLNDYAILNNQYKFWRLEVISSGDADKFKLYADNLCTPKWNEFVKTINGKKAVR
ncbi:MAG: hypothetical protein LBQ76_08135 [Candidatus Fibromonas sp.]|jgi:hypothetical protein|nr:hypothetical protein [Candidatus Fibromonas sp.]